MKFSDEFKEILDKHGGVNTSAPISAEETQRIPDYLSDDLKAFYQIYGRAVDPQGRMCVRHPDDLAGVVDLIFECDPDINPQDCVAYAYSAFYDIFVWHKDYVNIKISLYDGDINASAFANPPEVRTNLHRRLTVQFNRDAESFDMWDEDQKRMFSRCRKKYGQLEIGECYGFFPALGMGGVASFDHIKRTQTAPHFGLLAQLTDFNLINFSDSGQLINVRPIGKQN